MMIVYFIPGFLKNEVQKYNTPNCSTDTTGSSSTGSHVEYFSISMCLIFYSRVNCLLKFRMAGLVHYAVNSKS